MRWKRETDTEGAHRSHGGGCLLQRGTGLRLTCSKKRVFIEYCLQTFGRHATLNSQFLEHRNLLISIFVGNCLPDIKHKIKGSVSTVGWAAFDIIQTTYLWN